MPSGGGVGTARAIARAYSAFATGGEFGLRPETLALLAAPAVPPTHGFFDECMKNEVRFSLGFMKPSAGMAFGSPSSFGHPGAGGAMAFADPVAQIGYAYVTCGSGTTLTGDPRDVALREALYGALASATEESGVRRLRCACAGNARLTRRAEPRTPGGLSTKLESRRSDRHASSVHAFELP